MRTMMQVVFTCATVEECQYIEHIIGCIDGFTSIGASFRMAFDDPTAPVDREVTIEIGNTAKCEAIEEILKITGEYIASIEFITVDDDLSN